MMNGGLNTSDWFVKMNKKKRNKCIDVAGNVSSE
jgi:hypothetical protein